MILSRHTAMDMTLIAPTDRYVVFPHKESSPGSRVLKPILEIGV